MLTISKYDTAYQTGIDRMMEEIASEFEQPILPKIPGQVSISDHYWVALQDDEIIGTVALVIVQDFAILKKMMFKKDFRGKDQGVSKLLLGIAIRWCEGNHLEKIYLGTMRQFKAAHVFYEKNGFVEIALGELPEDFVNNPVDDVFYVLDLKK